jgi:hypothetical protein
VLRALALSVGRTHVRSRPELAARGSVVESIGNEPSPPHYHLPIVGYLLKVGLGEVAGAAVVEGVVGFAALLLLTAVVGLVSMGVVVPALDDDLGEEDEGDGVEGHVVLFLALELAVVEQVASRFHLFQGQFGLPVHVLQGLALGRSGLVDELGHDGQFGEVVEGFVVAKVNPVLHHVHLVQQTSGTLLQLLVRLMHPISNLLF